MIDLDRYRHISFDLDGTLVHTVAEYRHTVVPQTVAALGGTIQDPRDIDRFWFEAGRDALIQTAFGLEPKLFWQQFRELDTADGRALHTEAYPDAEITLRLLKERDKKISIITNAPQWIAEMEIKKLNGAPHDLFLPLSFGTIAIKPDPAGMHHVLQTLSAEAKETLYIGNSNEDALFARSAGVDFIYLERQEHEFGEDGIALATIHSLENLFAPI